MNAQTPIPETFEIVVHVGDGKTGTSAIQRSLREHPGELAAVGTQYVGLMLESSLARKYDWQDSSRIETFHALEPARATAELLDAIRASVASAKQAGFRRLVISNETLLGRSESTIAALAQLRGDGIRVTIVAYVRRHDGWARSAYLQWGLKHKTYDGPLRDFGQWAGKRRFALYPKLERWQAAFGPQLLVRNFDTVDDAAADFLSLLGVDPAHCTTTRRNEAPPAEELALRALFNLQSDGRVTPARFTRLLDTGKVDFGLPLEQWLQGMLPTSDQLRAVADACTEDREKVDALLTVSGQPKMSTDALPNPTVAIDRDVVLSVLFQIVARQAMRVEELEERLREVASDVAAARNGQSSPPAQVREPRPDVVEALAPALGYFGPLPVDCLEIQVAVPVREIHLKLAGSKPTFLNLRGLELVREGKALALESDHYEATQSSVASDNPGNGPDTLLAMKGIHSAAEHGPWWQVRFAEPLQIDAIRVFNRGDGWNSRSRTLQLDIVDAEGVTHRLHDGQSPALLWDAFATAARLADLPIPGGWPETAGDAAEMRLALLSGIAARLRSGTLPLKAVDWRSVVPLLGVWDDREPEAEEWTVIAGLLLAQQQGRGGTSIKTFSLLLDSQSRLRRLQQEVNGLASLLGLGGFMLTRHGLKPEGVLRREPDRFLSHMEAVIAALGALGREPVLAYGTLLGAVREGDFIAHDDDIDLLYRSTSRNRREVEAELGELKEALKARGFRVVDLLPNSLNMHVIDPGNGAVMDVFPSWEEGGLMQMHMESMKVRGIDPAILYPVGEVELRGRRLPAPARPEDYLRQRYGPDWQVSDQFFEWPWPIKAEEAQ